MTTTLGQIVIRILIAIVCAGLANVLVPRRIPGRLAGAIGIGLIGIWLGEWAFRLVRQEFGINYGFLYWQIQDVLIVPAVVGCTIVLYLVTTLLKWFRYTD